MKGSTWLGIEGNRPWAREALHLRADHGMTWSEVWQRVKVRHSLPTYSRSTRERIVRAAIKNEQEE